MRLLASSLAERTPILLLIGPAEGIRPKEYGEFARRSKVFLKNRIVLRTFQEFITPLKIFLS
jgi:16S rRNA U1498 N3-methylase RsmE